MKVDIKKALEGNYLKDRYSNGAIESQRIEGIPFISFPFEVKDLKKKYLSWVLIDYDSNPIVGFSWIHWLVSNYAATEEIEENLLNQENYLRGVNSFSSPVAGIKNEDIIHNYGGPTPPDKDHKYTFIVYAHDEKLNLEKCFYLNQLYDELNKIDYDRCEISFWGKFVK